MSNQDKDSKLFMGILVGGALGVGAIAVFMAMRKEKTPFSTLGEAIIHIGEILEHNHIKEPAALKRMEEKIQKEESSITQVIELISMGVNLWKQLKK